MKKQTLFALLLLLLIPAVTTGGGFLFSLINPEVAALHPNYVRNWRLLQTLKMSVMYGSMALVLTLYLLGCWLVIRSKRQSRFWLLLAPLGPLGFAILSVLNDRAPSGADRYSRFVRGLNGWLRAGYELCCFFLIWEFAYEVMVLKRNLMIWYQSATTGVSTTQIIAVQSASSGMWACGEGLQVMFFVIVLYLLRPTLFNLVGRLAGSLSPKAPRAR